MCLCIKRKKEFKKEEINKQEIKEPSEGDKLLSDVINIYEKFKQSYSDKLDTQWILKLDNALNHLGSMPDGVSRLRDIANALYLIKFLNVTKDKTDKSSFSTENLNLTGKSDSKDGLIELINKSIKDLQNESFMK